MVGLSGAYFTKLLDMSVKYMYIHLSQFLKNLNTSKQSLENLFLKFEDTGSDFTLKHEKMKMVRQNRSFLRMSKISCTCMYTLLQVFLYILAIYLTSFPFDIYKIHSLCVIYMYIALVITLVSGYIW